VEGSSLLPLMRGESVERPPYLHIEHAPAHQCLTDGREKYIWQVQDGKEHLFDLTKDPTECHDLAPDPAAAECLALWRRRLAAELEGRPEGFSDGENLIPGRQYGAVLPHALPESERT